MNDISLENYIKVKITESGKDILQKKIISNVEKMSKSSNIKFTPTGVKSLLDEDGYYQCTLSELMELYGSNLHKVPFEGDIKVIEFDKEYMMKVLSRSIDELTGGKLSKDYRMLENKSIHQIKFIEGTMFDFVQGKAINESTGDIVDSINVYLTPMTLLPGLLHGKINNDYTMDLYKKKPDLLYCVCKVKEDKEEKGKKKIEDKEYKISNKRNAKEIFKGGVYYAEIMSPLQEKSIRPILVVSTDEMNKYAPYVIAIPLTTNTRQFGAPIRIKLKAGDYPFLKGDNLLLVDNLMTVHKDSIKYRIGELNKDTMFNVQCSIKEVFDM